MNKFFVTFASSVACLVACSPETSKEHFMNVCAKDSSKIFCAPLHVQSIDRIGINDSFTVSFRASLSRPLQYLSIDVAPDPLQQDSAYDQIKAIRITQGQNFAIQVEPSNVSVGGTFQYGSQQLAQLFFDVPISDLLNINLKESVTIHVELLDWQGNRQMDSIAVYLIPQIGAKIEETPISN